MYKLNINLITNKPCSVNLIKDDGTTLSIPFDPANTDYKTFKYDLEHGVVLQDETGRSMTTQEITTLLGTLP
jgi:hypothetical protein